MYFFPVDSTGSWTSAFQRLFSRTHRSWPLRRLPAALMAWMQCHRTQRRIYPAFSRWRSLFGVIGGGRQRALFFRDIRPITAVPTLSGVTWSLDLLLDIIGEDICGVWPAKGALISVKPPPFAALFFSLIFLTRSPPEGARAPPGGSGFGPRHLFTSPGHDNPRSACHGRRFWRHKPPFCRGLFFLSILPSIRRFVVFGRAIRPRLVMVTR